MSSRKMSSFLHTLLAYFFNWGYTRVAAKSLKEKGRLKVFAYARVLYLRAVSPLFRAQLSENHKN